MCHLDDVTAKSLPRYFWIVLALAGDSTITRLVALSLPLITGLPALRALPLVLFVLLRRGVFVFVFDFFVVAAAFVVVDFFVFFVVFVVDVRGDMMAR